MPGTVHVTAVPRLTRTRVVWALCASLLAGAAPASHAAGAACVAAGQWVAGAGARPVADVPGLFAALARRPVVLLGELHDRADHHRWQLHVLAALHAREPRIAIGFEMFPRRAQPVLDRWVAGELTEAELLERTRWEEVWNIDPALYLPLFHFARMHRLPMIALNVDRSVLRTVAEKGWEAVPAGEREGVGRPAPPPADYLRELEAVFRQHPTGGVAAAEDERRLQRFVAGQTFWDRAMAEAIAASRTRFPERMVIGVLGMGHARPGAVPHQLRALGVEGAAVLLPWEPGSDCGTLAKSGAEAVFGLDAPAPVPAQPRLGVALTGTDTGVRIDNVEAGSIAAGAGLRAGDVLIRIAGAAARSVADVRRAVGRQAPGTWLPLRVRREGVELDLVARFPP